MREPTRTEAIDLVGRGEAEQELPEQMRADVRLLGGLLGRVLRESGSPGLFDDVERLRLATIAAYTDESDEAFERAASIADSFSIERADEVARAFTVYFHLVNLTEEHQRVRVLLERNRRPDQQDASDSVLAAFTRLATEIGDDAALERLQAMRFHPVFTAHPTEARRRAVSSSIRRLARLRCPAARTSDARSAA
jgi:phosphoenolpyruvate carboxylase